MKGNGPFQTLIFIVPFLPVYLVHAYLVDCGLSTPDCLLFYPYLFLLSFSIIVIITFLILSQIKKLRDQLGFIYIGALMVKLVLFVAIFNHYFFNDSFEIQLHKGHFLVPVFVGLACEVAFLSRLLQRIE